MKILIAFFAFWIAAISYGEVWPTQNQWNESWEQKYSEWVKVAWTNDIFIRPGSLLEGIKTDCAEATYSMRASFAYLNHLDFSVHAADQKSEPRIITNRMTEFDAESAGDRRFRKFLQYVLRRVNSTSLAVDTFPIHIDREHFVPGIVYVSPGEHSFQIIDLSDTGVPVTLNSTTPAEARLLFHSEGFPFYMPKDFTRHLDGYRAFREPQELDTPVERLPRAGFEQYQDSQAAGLSYFKFTDRMLQRLALRPESEDEKAKRNFTNLCFYSRERAPRVIEAYLLWSEHGRRCLSSGDFYGHSTFDRDVQLKDYFLAVKSLSEEAEFAEVNANLRKEIQNIFSGSMVENIYDNNLPNLNPQSQSDANHPRCVVELGVPQRPILSLREVWQLIEANKLVSDPNATILQRWGLEPFTPTCK